MKLHILLTKYILDQVHESEIGGTCSLHGKMRNVYKILLGEPERLNTNRRIILKWILEKLGLGGGGGY
jgi:hypothetical protein